MLRTVSPNRSLATTRTCPARPIWATASASSTLQPRADAECAGNTCVFRKYPSQAQRQLLLVMIAVGPDQSKRNAVLPQICFQIRPPSGSGRACASPAHSNTASPGESCALRSSAAIRPAIVVRLHAGDAAAAFRVVTGEEHRRPCAVVPLYRPPGSVPPWGPMVSNASIFPPYCSKQAFSCLSAWPRSVPG